MGVWIEICIWRKVYTYDYVTPFMGVWIEIYWAGRLKIRASSHPLWVCGLKSLGRDDDASFSKSHPLWVCGLK